MIIIISIHDRLMKLIWNSQTFAFFPLKLLTNVLVMRFFFFFFAWYILQSPSRRFRQKGPNLIYSNKIYIWIVTFYHMIKFYKIWRRQSLRTQINRGIDNKLPTLLELFNKLHPWTEGSVIFLQKFLLAHIQLTVTTIQFLLLTVKIL